jgi:hypothetical protein
VQGGRGAPLMADRPENWFQAAPPGSPRLVP